MKSIKLQLFALFMMFSGFIVNSQTSQQTGTWEDNATWVGDAPGYTFGNNVTITINLNHVVETAENVLITFQNNATLNVYGTLIINGNISVLNNLSLNVFENGIMIVNGNLNLNNNGTLEVNGSLDVDTISGNNNNEVIGDGTINVDYIDGVDTDDFDGVIITDPMPVELLYFRVQSLASSIYVEWATASESNNDYYSIERSNDGTNWESISLINGAGNSNNVSTYSFSDFSPFIGIAYYRLKQTDFDGKYEYFSPVGAFFQNTLDDAKIINSYFKNGNLNLWVNVLISDGIINIYDLNGRIIHSERVVKSDFTQNLSIDLSNYNGALLLINLTSTTGRDTSKVLAQ